MSRSTQEADQDTDEVHRVLGQLRARVDCEGPNADIHSFSGALTITFAPAPNTPPATTQESGELGAGAGAGAGVVPPQVASSSEAGSPALSETPASSGRPSNVFPASLNNFVLRGCSMQNTDFAYGVVVYTGKETKVMKKSVKVRSKMSRVEKMVNKIVWIILFAQVRF